MLFLTIMAISIGSGIAVIGLFCQDEITLKAMLLLLLFIVPLFFGSAITVAHFIDKYEQKVYYSETLSFSKFSEAIEYLTRHEYLDKNTVAVDCDSLDCIVKIDHYNGKINWKYIIGDVDSVKIYIKK